MRSKSEQRGESSFKVVRKKHPRSAKSMVVIHAQIRPRSTATSVNERKHVKDPDTFPSVRFYHSTSYFLCMDFFL